MRVRSHGSPHRAAILIVASVLGTGTLPTQSGAQLQVGRQSDASVILPTGQRITPAGTQLIVNSMPIAAEVSPDGRYLIVLQAGYETPSLSVIDTAAQMVSGGLELPDAWLGLTLNKAGNRIYVGGGTRGSVWVLSYRDGAVKLEREFPVGGECAGECNSLIGDVLLDVDGRTLYALDVLRDRVIVINSQSGLVLGEFPTGVAPYRARATPDGQHLVISHWGEASLGLYRLSDQRLVERIPVGEHPTDLRLVTSEVSVPGSGFDGDEVRTYPVRLFAACAHSDNLWTFGVTERNRFDLLDARSVAPRPDSRAGSSPSGLGVSQDGRTLYIANSGNNTILVVDIEEALPEPNGALPTAWFPTGVVGLKGGALAYLSGKGDVANPGLVGLLPALTTDQLEFLTAAAVANLLIPKPAAVEPPAAVRHVALVLSDARGAVWQGLLEDSAFLKGYVPAASGQLSQTAWLTSGAETDFFAKLGPAVSAGRLSEQELAAAGRAAAPPAGTLWSNAEQAALSSETYGIAGGRPPSALITKIAAGTALPRLAVIRFTGSPAQQDEDLGRLLTAVREHEAYKATALFVVPTGGPHGAAVTGGSLGTASVIERFISSASLLRTVEWLLGLRPMTQFDAAASPITQLFAETR